MFDSWRKYIAGGVCRCDTRLEGKTVIITGGNTGIGKETARDLAGRGARVILGCRDETRAETAAKEIREATGNQQVVYKQLDLASLDSVRSFAKDITDEEKRLDVLINNAGVMACPKWTTKDGFEYQFGVNHLGHFLLTNLLLNLMKSSSDDGRIITVSSRAHIRCSKDIQFDDINLDKCYDSFQAYSRSKLSNILFTLELSRRLEGSNVSTFAVHPGVVNTDMFRSLRQISRFYAAVSVCMKYPLYAVGKTPSQGAQSSIHCAVAPGLASRTGKYFIDCKESETSAMAADKDLAGKLWDMSEIMVGLGQQP